jgi:Zn-dependent protease with chaperone function
MPHNYVLRYHDLKPHFFSHRKLSCWERGFLASCACPENVPHDNLVIADSSNAPELRKVLKKICQEINEPEPRLMLTNQSNFLATAVRYRRTIICNNVFLKLSEQSQKAFLMHEMRHFNQNSVPDLAFSLLQKPICAITIGAGLLLATNWLSAAGIYLSLLIGSLAAVCFNRFYAEYDADRFAAAFVGKDALIDIYKEAITNTYSRTPEKKGALERIPEIFYPKSVEKRVKYIGSFTEAELQRVRDKELAHARTPNH